NDCMGFLQNLRQSRITGRHLKLQAKGVDPLAGERGHHTSFPEGWKNIHGAYPFRVKDRDSLLSLAQLKSRLSLFIDPMNLRSLDGKTARAPSFSQEFAHPAEISADD